MPSLEVVENIFWTEQFQIATADSDKHASDVAATYKAVAADPGGIVFTHGKSSVEKRIQHRTLEEVKLQVVLAIQSNNWPLDIEGINQAYHPVSTYWQMGVIEPRGMMAFGVEEHKVPYVDFSDPYIEMIVSFFKSHLEANN